MKKIFVFTIVLALSVFAGAANDQQYKGDSPPGSKSGPTWFNVQTTDLCLTVADTGIFGGFYQSNDRGLFYHIFTPRPPDHRGTSGYALHSNPTFDEGKYGNNWNTYAMMPLGIPIPAGSTASVSFWAHWSMEENCDGVRLEIAKSDDNYSTWECLQPTGSEPASPIDPIQSTWGGYFYDGSVGGYGIWNTEYTCAIPAAYIGKTVKFRFHFGSDSSDVSTGFLVDDFAIIVNGSPLITYTFNNPTGPDMWVTDNYWGVTAQTLWTDLCLFQGELIAGVSSSYIVDYFDFDWQAFGADYGPPIYLRQTSRWTAPAGQPKFDMDTYFYTPSGSGAGKYIIVDCYLKHVSGDFNTVFIACNMEPSVEIPFNDYSQYDSSQKMIWLNYDGNLNGDCMGIMYLAPGSTNPYAARIRQTASWGNEAVLYSEMSTAGFSAPVSNHKVWTLISAGPYSPADFLPQPICGVKRFTFAFVCGDNSTELFNNATSCRQWYDANLASNPQIPTKVAPASLGNIKALYR